MEQNNIKIENHLELLHYPKVLSYFKDFSNVLNVTTTINGEKSIDFETITKLIDSLSAQPNLYGLCTKEIDAAQWDLRYIGQRKAKDIKQRLYQHLIKKHEDTGAQLDQITTELRKGNLVGIKLLCVVPDELRHYYEELLLKDITTDWNINK